MQRDRVHLLDILESARLAVAYLGCLSYDEFLSDVQKQDSVIRRLEIIGEAARRVSSEGRAELGDLAWNEMVGLRNAMIHEYDAVDLTVVWDTVKADLPPLVRRLEEALGDEMG